jgi:RNA polymerase sigma-70 factor (ECF subfamily)
MTTAALNILLEKLASGQLEAAAEAFRAYEPYLRKVARRLLPGRLRTKVDSEDVVQSVWADVLRGFQARGRRFASAAHLRAFLVMLTRHRLGDRLRYYQQALDKEQPLTGTGRMDGLPSAEPRPSQLVQAQDLWQRMLALCPPAHHEVLWLKRKGLPLAQIAAQTGLHEGSVRRILRRLARQLALGAAATLPQTQTAKDLS